MVQSVCRPVPGIYDLRVSESPVSIGVVPKVSDVPVPNRTYENRGTKTGGAAYIYISSDFKIYIYI